MMDKLIIEDVTLPIFIRRSHRKTLAISVTEGIELNVKAPMGMADAKIEKFINQKRVWIYKQAKRIQEENAKHVEYTKREETLLRERARHVLTEKTDKYKKELNVEYKKIRIGDQKTRWGSCSSKGIISYNWRLILMPEDIQDYVVVHELCHLHEMNHSMKFWEWVSKIIPDYKEKDSWLDKHGGEY